MKDFPFNSAKIPAGSMYTSTVTQERTDDVTCKVFQRRLSFRQDAIAAENIKAGMPPCREHGNHLFSRSMSKLSTVYLAQHF